ncbi:hypothetical protein VT84_33075 [Gemmata sp. SH-PL17]|uniref:trypsin-like peptidase domain-containing protein n=1 Tax=Gemmata sp. SH-PL17 TaxID=1630693 RepID=UPI00078B4F71|nr:trypsin-like peptidase domain-containing protein [Gemmata sp. SH-PL17]AMV29275.1 hypothetical protein VT84_33075 [Gemmata sp. SH-PL17]
MFRARLLVLLALLLTVPVVSAAPDRMLVPEPLPQKLALEGPTKYKPYQLVRVKASGLDPKAGIIWRVYPSQDVQRATTPRGILEFAAPPGTYQIEALVITTGADGAISVDEQAMSVEIESCCDKAPPIVPPTPQPPIKPKANPVAALGKIQFGNAGCTATVIGPRRADGKWDVLTAAHCVTHVGVGAKGSMTLPDGRKLAIKVGSIYETPDCAWLTTEDATLADLPFAEIAASNPPVGTKIWHKGYGVDVPGNREDGEITFAQDGNGQLQMSLSVSSGDSGGGIFRDDTGELISCVCCTTAKGQKARVWGCAADIARKYRPGASGTETWTPIEIPDAGIGPVNVWEPVDMPTRRVLEVTTLK